MNVGFSSSDQIGHSWGQDRFHSASGQHLYGGFFILPHIVYSLPCLLSQGAEAGLGEEGQAVDTFCEEVVQACGASVVRE